MLHILLINMLLEFSNLLLLGHKELLESFNLRMEGWCHLFALDKLELVIRFLLWHLGDERLLRLRDSFRLFLLVNLFVTFNLFLLWLFFLLRLILLLLRSFFLFFWLFLFLGLFLS